MKDRPRRSRSQARKVTAPKRQLATGRGHENRIRGDDEQQGASQALTDRLQDSLSLTEEGLNLLFAALLLTSMTVYVGGNVLLSGAAAWRESLPIALACLGLLPVFYALSRLTKSVTWGLVLVYGLMLVMVYSRQAWLIPLMYAGVLSALVYTAFFLRVKRAQWPLLVLMAVAGAVVILSTFGFYTSFDMLPRLKLGDVHQDTLFHASIAAMIKTYGVASTGLHGLVLTPYHTLSHALIAGVSLLADTGVLETYGVAPWVFFAPILIFSAVACGTLLDRTNRLNLPLAWGLICALLILCPFVLERWGVWRSFLISESYLVSLGLLLIGFPLLFKRRLSTFDLLLITILTALIANAKASVGVVFAALWFARVLFVRGGQIRLDLAAFVLSAAVTVWVTFRSAEANQEIMRVLPFEFVAAHTAWGEYINKIRQAQQIGTQAPLSWSLLAGLAVASFLLFHFLLTWVIVVQGIRRKGLKAIVTDPLSVYALAAAAVGIGIVALFSMGSSVYYFSNVAFFVALPGVAVLLAGMLTRWKASTYILLASTILLTCVLIASSLNQENPTRLARPHSTQSAFVDALVELRRQAPINTAVQLLPEAAAFNPIAKCTAQPFVYPAVSERVWISAILPRNDCAYLYYAYDQYGVSGGQPTVTVQPRLLPGMKVLNWPATTAQP